MFDTHYYFIILVSLAILSVIVSYIHLTILSPLSDVRQRIKDGLEEADVDIVEETEE